MLYMAKDLDQFSSTRFNALEMSQISLTVLKMLSECTTVFTNKMLVSHALHVSQCFSYAQSMTSTYNVSKRAVN